MTELLPTSWRRGRERCRDDGAADLDTERKAVRLGLAEGSRRDLDQSEIGVISGISFHMMSERSKAVSVREGRGEEVIVRSLLATLPTVPPHVVPLASAQLRIVIIESGFRFREMDIAARTVACAQARPVQTMDILLIEDDPMIGRSLVRTLLDAGLTVEWVRDGIKGADAMTNGEHGLVLLDLGLPARGGLDLLDDASRQGLARPLIVITARDDLDSRVLALDLGADDYLLKPFEGRELLARIRAVARRHAGQTRARFELGRLILDLTTREVIYDGLSAILPPREFALLRVLAERPGTIFSRSELEARLYGNGEEREGNAIDVLIHYVRKRFGKAVIQNVRGAGWMVLKER